MKSKHASRWIVAGIVSSAVFITQAAELRKATVTRVVNKVDVVEGSGQLQPAATGTTIQGNTGVQTGAKSLAELQFPDQTLARLGANTLFSFEAGTRSVELENGTILLQVPKNAGGAKIKTAPVTAAITGTTVLIEYAKGGLVKLIVIEGEVRLSLNNRVGESVVVGAGQMVTLSSKGNSLPSPQDVDLKRILKTSKLINAGPLGNQKEITTALGAQDALKNKGVLVKVDFMKPNAPGPIQITERIQNAINNNRTVATGAPQPPPTPAPTPPPPPKPVMTPYPKPPPPSPGPRP